MLIKRILKYVLAVVILIGVVFGIIAITRQRPHNEYLVDELSNTNVQTALKANNQLDANVNSFKVNMLSSENTNYASIKTDFQSGDMEYYLVLNTSNHALYGYFYKMTSLVGATNSANNVEIKNLLNNAISSQQTCKNALVSLTNYIASCEANPTAFTQDYLNTYFNAFKLAYKTYQGKYSQFICSLAGFVNTNAFNNSNAKLVNIVATCCAQMNKNALLNDASQTIIDEDKTIITKTAELLAKTQDMTLNNYEFIYSSKDIVFINTYFSMPNMNQYLLSAEKTKTIEAEEPTTEMIKDYENRMIIYNYLFVEAE